MTYSYMDIRKPHWGGRISGEHCLYAIMGGQISDINLME
jgi:hypothetical protein